MASTDDTPPPDGQELADGQERIAAGEAGAGDGEDETGQARPRVSRPDLDRIFGDVLPDTTSDERGPGRDSRGTDDWYLGNRPPHHGG
ncbi:hypothetical protein [Actinokineospora enzanensis]|uniref:hypothetical protein n=1 Tax=Actinokineospora enzanensis TaxID=155975 RepID=UPI000366AEDB|nr:hypothetical protein [Actinokineospora enzanensis]